jgi:hypothetical protein
MQLIHTDVPKVSYIKQNKFAIYIYTKYFNIKAPSKQSPPKLKPLSASSILVTWHPPEHPNGIITYYTVSRNDSLVHNTTGKSKMNSIKSFHSIIFKTVKFIQILNSKMKICYLSLSIHIK